MAVEMTDLDEYFCKKYANYDKLCVLPGYQMPKMQDSKIDANGFTRAYTLPPETMALDKQANKAEILQELKARLVDQTFSFSFSTQSFFRRFGNLFRKYTPGKVLRAVLTRHNLTMEESGKLLNIQPEVWKGIYKGTFVLTKNALYSLALTANFSGEEVDMLFDVCAFEWDFTQVKDVVMSYLLQNRVYNLELVQKAFAQYRIENMFIPFA